MPRLAGINYYVSVNACVPPLGDYLIGREQPDTSKPEGRALLELAPVYAEVRNKRDPATTRSVLLSVGFEADSPSYFTKLRELIDKYGMDADLLDRAADIALILGEEAYRNAVVPREYRTDSKGLTYRNLDSSVQHYSGALMFPYSGDFMRFSHRHAELTPTSDGLLVRDVGSTHGTAVDGTVIGVNRRIEEIGQDERHNIPRERLKGEAEAPYGSVISLSPLVFGDDYSLRVERNGGILG